MAKEIVNKVLSVVIIGMMLLSVFGTGISGTLDNDDLTDENIEAGQTSIDEKPENVGTDNPLDYSFLSKLDPSLRDRVLNKVKGRAKVIVLTNDVSELAQTVSKFDYKGLIGTKGTLGLSTPVLDLPIASLYEISSLDSVIGIVEYPELVNEIVDPYEAFGLNFDGTDPIVPKGIFDFQQHLGNQSWVDGFIGSGVRVAVPEGGVDFGHPDLQGRQARETNPASPYYGWPIVFDVASMTTYLENGETEGTWYVDTSEVQTDVNTTTYNPLIDTESKWLSAVNVANNTIYKYNETMKKDKNLKIVDNPAVIYFGNWRDGKLVNGVVHENVINGTLYSWNQSRIGYLNATNNYTVYDSAAGGETGPWDLPPDRNNTILNGTESFLYGNDTVGYRFLDSSEYNFSAEFHSVSLNGWSLNASDAIYGWYDLIPWHGLVEGLDYNVNLFKGEIYPLFTLADNQTISGSYNYTNPSLVIVPPSQIEAQIGKPSSPGSTEFLNLTGLTPNMTYIFSIRAADEAGWVSDLSNNPNAAAGIDTVPPSMITDLDAVPGTVHGSVDLIFNTTGDDGIVGTADRYIVKYYKDQITNWVSYDYLAQEYTEVIENPEPYGIMQTITLTGFDPGATLFFAMQAVDEAGNKGRNSNTDSTVVMDDITAPALINDLIAYTGGNSTEIVLTWNATGDDGPVGNANRYIVKYSTAPINAGNFDLVNTYAQSWTPKGTTIGENYTLDGFVAGTTYFLAIKAVDEAGNEGAINTGSISAVAQVTDITDPAQITDLTITTGDSHWTVFFNFTAPGDDNMIGWAVDYQIRARNYTDGPIITEANWTSSYDYNSWSGDVFSPKAGGMNENLTIGRAIFPGTVPDQSSYENELYWAIRAEDEAGRLGPISSGIALNHEISNESVYGPAPAADTTVFFWLGHGNITDATIYVEQETAGNWSGLIGGVDYVLNMTTGFIDVSAGIGPLQEFANISAWYNYSSTSAFMKEDTTGPGDITDLGANPSPIDGQVELDWTAPGDDGGTGTVSQYEIRYDTSPIVTWPFNYPNGKRATIDLKIGGTTGFENPAEHVGGTAELYTPLSFGTKLVKGTTYYFAIRAYDEWTPNVNAISNSPFSKPSNDTKKPGQINLAAATADRDGEVSLNWTAPADDNYNASSGNVQNYEIRYTSAYFETKHIESDVKIVGLLNKTYYTSARYNITGINSASGNYRLGYHPDENMAKYINGDLANGTLKYAKVLLVDSQINNSYDTIYVDIDGDEDFSDEKPGYFGDEAVYQDTTGDGLADISGGIFYYISRAETLDAPELLTVQSVDEDIWANLAHKNVMNRSEELTWQGSRVLIGLTIADDYNVTIPHNNITGGTLVVFRNGNPVNAADYTADLDNGIITFNYKINKTADTINGTYDFDTNIVEYTLDIEEGNITFTSDVDAATDTVTIDYQYDGLPIPYSDRFSERRGVDNIIPKNGEMVAFFGEFTLDATSGTGHASAIAGQGKVPFGDNTSFKPALGMAPNATIIGITGSLFDSLMFAAEGYDGLPGTGDEANIITSSLSQSSIYESGFDLYSKFFDWLTVDYSKGRTAITVTSGGSGSGYGTVTAPGAAPGVITAGLATNFYYRAVDSQYDGGPNPKSGDVITISGRGPSMLGNPKPDIVSAGGYFSFTSQPLYTARDTDDNSNPVDLWLYGHALTAPTAAGGLALVYDAFYTATHQVNGEIALQATKNTTVVQLDHWNVQAGYQIFKDGVPQTEGTGYSIDQVNGTVTFTQNVTEGQVITADYAYSNDYPLSQEAKTILMSGADDINYDVSTQGAGYMNTHEAAKIASETDGISVSPYNWVPGDYGGQRYAAFPNVVISTTDNASLVETFTVKNHGVAPVNTALSAKVIRKTGESMVARNPEFVDGSFGSINTILKGTGLYDKDGNLLAKVNKTLWDNAELIKISAFSNSSNYWLELFDWTDVNGNGRLDLDKTSSAADQDPPDPYPGAIGFGERNRWTGSFSNVNLHETRVYNPANRSTDGIYIWNRAMDAIDPDLIMYIKVEFYGKTDWDWLTLNTTSLNVGAGEEMTFTATLDKTKALAAGVGTYQGAIYSEASGKTVVIPIVINVGAENPKFTFGGENDFEVNNETLIGSYVDTYRTIKVFEEESAVGVAAGTMKFSLGHENIVNDTYILFTETLQPLITNETAVDGAAQGQQYVLLDNGSLTNPSDLTLFYRGWGLNLTMVNVSVLERAVSGQLEFFLPHTNLVNTGATMELFYQSSGGVFASYGLPYSVDETTGKVTLTNPLGDDDQFWATYQIAMDTTVLVTIMDEIVIGPTVGGETGPFNLDNQSTITTILNMTLYLNDSGAFIKLSEGLNYSLDYNTGEINMLVASEPNELVYGPATGNGTENGTWFLDYNGIIDATIYFGNSSDGYEQFTEGLEYTLDYITGELNISDTAFFDVVNEFVVNATSSTGSAFLDYGNIKSGSVNLTGYGYVDNESYSPTVNGGIGFFLQRNESQAGFTEIVDVYRLFMIDSGDWADVQILNEGSEFSLNRTTGWIELSTLNWGPSFIGEVYYSNYTYKETMEDPSNYTLNLTTGEITFSPPLVPGGPGGGNITWYNVTANYSVYYIPLAAGKEIRASYNYTLLNAPMAIDQTLIAYYNYSEMVWVTLDQELYVDENNAVIHKELIDNGNVTLNSTLLMDGIHSGSKIMATYSHNVTKYLDSVFYSVDTGTGEITINDTLVPKGLPGNTTVTSWYEYKTLIDIYTTSNTNLVDETISVYKNGEKISAYGKVTGEIVFNNTNLFTNEFLINATGGETNVTIDLVPGQIIGEGTYTIYLNGTPLVETVDYAIDLVTGEITFHDEWPLPPKANITADFTSYDPNVDTIYLAHGELFPGFKDINNLQGYVIKLDGTPEPGLFNVDEDIGKISFREAGRKFQSGDVVTADYTYGSYVIDKTSGEITFLKDLNEFYIFTIDNETVFGPAVGGETGPFNLIKTNITSLKLYREDGGSWTLIPSNRYLLNATSGEIDITGSLPEYVNNETAGVGDGGTLIFNLVNQNIIDLKLYLDDSGSWTKLVEDGNYSLNYTIGEIDTLSAVKIDNETVFGPATGGETGPFNLANGNVINSTIYTTNGTGVWNKTTEGVDYTLNYITGEINASLSPLNLGDTVYAYYNYSTFSGRPVGVLNPGQSLHAFYNYSKPIVPLSVNQYLYGNYSYKNYLKADNVEVEYNYSYIDELLNPSVSFGGFSGSSGVKSGDWRYYYVTIPDVGLYDFDDGDGIPDPKLFIKTEWSKQETDLDVFAFGSLATTIPSSLSKDTEFSTDRYGPYGMTNNGGSTETATFFTASGGPLEYSMPSIGAGLNVIAIHAVRMNGTSNWESFKGEVGTYTLDKEKVEIVTNQLSGSTTVNSVSNIDIGGSMGGVAAGPSAPERYEDQLVYQDDPDWTKFATFEEQLASGNTSIYISVENSLIFDVHIYGHTPSYSREGSFADVDDLDLGIFLDANGDGITQVEEFVAMDADSDANEQVKLIAPADGDYIIRIFGFTLKTVPAHYDIDITNVQGLGFGVEGEGTDLSPDETNMWKTDVTQPAYESSGISLTWDLASAKNGITLQGALYVGPGDGAFATLMPIELRYDSIAPVSGGTTPGEGAVTKDNNPLITASFRDDDGATRAKGELDASTAKLILDGVDITDQSSISVPFEDSDEAAVKGYFTGTLAYTLPGPLSDGVHIGEASISDFAGNEIVNIWSFTVDTGAPGLELDIPDGDYYTTMADFKLTGSTEPDTDFKVLGAVVDNVAVDPLGRFGANIQLDDGMNQLTISATDEAGNKAEITQTIVLDTEMPEFEAIRSKAGSLTNKDSTTITGKASERGTMSINSDVVIVNSDGTFNRELSLNEGENVFNVEFTDYAGNRITETLTVEKDTTAPLIVLNSAPTEVTTESYEFSGQTDDDVILSVNGKQVSIGTRAGEFNRTVLLSDGPNTIVIEAKDSAGNIMELRHVVNLVSPIDDTTNWLAIGVMVTLLIIGLLIGLFLAMMLWKDKDEEDEPEPSPGEDVAAAPVVEDALIDEEAELPEDAGEDVAEVSEPDEDVEEISEPGEELPIDDEKVQKLTQAYEDGKISQELYEKNLASLTAQAREPVTEEVPEGETQPDDESEEIVIDPEELEGETEEISPERDEPLDDGIAEEIPPELEGPVDDDLTAEEISEQLIQEEDIADEPDTDVPADESGEEVTADEPEMEVAESDVEDIPAEEPPIEDERVLKLKQAFEDGKISQELYEKNLARLMKK